MVNWVYILGLMSEYVLYTGPEQEMELFFEKFFIRYYSLVVVVFYYKIHAIWTEKQNCII